MTGLKDHKKKLELLRLAEQLGNVSQACKVMRYSRDSFYWFKRLYDEPGLREISLQEPIRNNRGEPTVEAAVEGMAIDQPVLG